MIKLNFNLSLLLISLFAANLSFAADPVLEYKFSSDSGSFVSDTSGNDLHGHIEGSGTQHFAPGISGRGLKLNGIDNFVLVPDNPIFDFNRYTLMAWVKYEQNQWDREEIMEKAGSFWVNIRKDTRKVRAGGFLEDAIVPFYFKFDSNKIVPENEWTHVTVTYDSSTLRIYINGILAGKSLVPVPGSVCVNTEPLSIGSKHRTISPPEDAAFFRGIMDSVRLFDVALPAWRIKQEMAK